MCDTAMAGGHFEVVLWALQNGCKADEAITEWLRNLGVDGK